MTAARAEKSPPGVLLWDVDGTLTEVARSRQDKHLAAAESVLEARISAPPSWTGRTDAEILQGLMLAAGAAPSEATRRAMLSELDRLTLAELEAMPATSAPGIEGTLIAAAEQGWTNGLLTGNTRGRARAKLESAGLAYLVDWQHAYSGEDATSREKLVTDAMRHLDEDLPGHLVVLIGDTPRDVLAARAAGVAVVAVATGLYLPDELESYGPSLTLRDLEAGRSQLLTFLRSHRAP